MSQQVAPGVRFGVFGFPVHVDPSFFLLTGLLGASRLGSSLGLAGLLSWVLAVFVSVLWHELGHAVAFRRFNLQPAITLYSMGGLTSARGRLTWGRSLVTSLAGPLTGLALGAVVWWLGESGTWPQSTLFERVLASDLVYVNVVWGLVNLLPIHPLDGGQSFEAVLHLLKVKRAARKVALTSIVVAGLGATWGLYENRLFLVLVGGWLAWMNVKRLRAMPGSGTPPPAGPMRAA